MKSGLQEGLGAARQHGHSRPRANGFKRPAESRPARKKSFDNKKFEKEFEFQYRCRDLPPVEQQFAIANSRHPKNKRRRYRFDFCVPDFKLLIEIDGGIWLAGGGAHSHPLDIERNMRKQNDATLLGYRLIRFTPEEVTNGHAISFTQKVLFAQGWRNHESK
jgi:very-short-patch-repair endonuclease